MHGFILNHETFFSSSSEALNEVASNEASSNESSSKKADASKAQDQDQGQGQDKQTPRQASDECRVYGLLENGEKFIWKFQFPYTIGFTKEDLPENTYQRKISNRFKDFRGNPLNCYFFFSKGQVREILNHYPDLQLQEHDISPIEQYLMAEGIKSQINFLSPPQQRLDGVVEYVNPKVEPSSFFYDAVLSNSVSNSTTATSATPPQGVFTYLSIDIETSVLTSEIYSIALAGENTNKVLLRYQAKELTAENFDLEIYPTEKELLLAFKEEIFNIDPDIIMGWNIMGFDFSFLYKRFEEFKIDFDIGVGREKVIRFVGQKSKQEIIKIPGRAFLEGIEVCKYFYPHLLSYSLNNVAAELLGQEKIIVKDGLAKIKEIDNFYLERPLALCEYNLLDAKLVVDILNKVNGLEFMLKRSLITGVTLEKLKNPLETLDYAYLPRLHKRMLASYNPATYKSKATPPDYWATYLKGFHENIFWLEFPDFIFDVIISYALDPLAFIAATHKKKDLITTPRGTKFSKPDAILPEIISEYKNLSSKKPGYKKEVEVALNDFLKALNNPKSRLYFPGLSRTIYDNVLFLMEQLANKLMEKLMEHFPSPLNKVVYVGDKDIILSLSEKDSNQPNQVDAQSLEKLIREKVEEILPQVIPLSNFVSLKSVTHFSNMFLPQQKRRLEFFAKRKGDGKGDVGEVIFNETEKRGQLPIIAFLKEKIILEKFLSKDIKALLNLIKQEILDKKHDEKLIYLGRLSKKLEDIELSNSFFSQATRKSKEYLEEHYKFGITRVNLRYVVDKDLGGVPLLDQEKVKTDLEKLSLDYNHYLEKEVLLYFEHHFAGTGIENYLTELKVDDFQLDFFS